MWHACLLGCLQACAYPIRVSINNHEWWRSSNCNRWMGCHNSVVQSVCCFCRLPPWPRYTWKSQKPVRMNAMNRFFLAVIYPSLHCDQFVSFTRRWRHFDTLINFNSAFASSCIMCVNIWTITRLYWCDSTVLEALRVRDEVHHGAGGPSKYCTDVTSVHKIPVRALAQTSWCRR